MRSSRILLLAWRESRFARRRLLLFLSAISLGVAALVAVRGFARNLERGVEREAKSLLGADLELRSREPFTGGTLTLLDSLRLEAVPVARMTAFASMAFLPRTGETRLVQVRATEPGYPFYGSIETAPADEWERLQAGRHALADPALFAALGASIGDSISVGAARFALIGELRKVPGDVELASSFAPRLYIPAEYLEATGLLEFGSRVDHSAFVSLDQPEVIDGLISGHRELFRAERVRSETAAEQQRDISRALERLSSYLGLVGVFALLLGGIGVASAMSAYMAAKVDTIAVLRCLGATARQVLAIYLLQAMAMGLVGAMVGAGIGAAVQWILPVLARGLLPVDAVITLDGLSMLIGVGIGTATAVVFALLPLLAVRRVSPLGALRRRVDPIRTAGRDPARMLAFLAIGGGVVALLSMQVGSVGAGAGLAAGIAVTLLLLGVVASGIGVGVRRLPRGAFEYPIRQGLANLYRPGNQTRVVTVALGFGVFLLATLMLAQQALLSPLRPDIGVDRANLLFWDVQDDQVGGVEELLASRSIPVLQRAPIIPMRIAAVRGEPVGPVGAPEGDDDGVQEEDGGGRGSGGRTGDGGEPRPERWAVRREYRSTYRDSSASAEVLTAGAWWRPGEGAEDGVYPISLERDIAGDLRVQLGDRIDWDVQGVRIATRVTSLRQVDWARFEPNFFAVFPEAALRDAPQTWVLLGHAGSEAQRTEIQREGVIRFPNVAVVDLTRIQEALDEVLGRVSAVIRFVAAFSILTGFVVLLGAVATSRLERIRESVLLRALGATRQQIRVILVTEYLCLGLLAAATGILLSLAGTWALARWFLDVEFAPTLAPLLIQGVAVAILAVLVGMWGSREVFQRTSLEAIRDQ